MTRRGPLVVAAACLLALSTGCAGPTVHVSVAWPGVAAAEVEQAIAVPLEDALAGVEHLASAQIVSANGWADAYATGRRGTDAEVFLSAVRKAAEAAAQNMPAEAAAPEVALVSKPPRYAGGDAETVPVLNVAVRQEQARELGMTAAEAAGLVNEALAGRDPSQVSAEQLAGTEVAWRGRKVRLGEVAVITIERQPKRIIRRLPRPAGR